MLDTHFQKILSWGLRLVALYLFLWWTILYLSFASLEPLGIRDFFIAISVGALHSAGVFLSTVNQCKLILYLVTAPLIIVEFWLFVHSLLSGALIVDFIGVSGCILSVIYILKKNKGETGNGKHHNA